MNIYTHEISEFSMKIILNFRVYYIIILTLYYLYTDFHKEV